ncbi:MAG: hypothetical protein GC134_09635 [Proteobacteria bacterium]|nr:hypothetical protein [Pseudomonadota bacterium]
MQTIRKVLGFVLKSLWRLLLVVGIIAAIAYVGYTLWDNRPRDYAEPEIKGNAFVTCPANATDLELRAGYKVPVVENHQIVVQYRLLYRDGNGENCIRIVDQATFEKKVGH